jgi:hypothetical protein
MPLHPAENRGYRELYLTGRQLVGRWGRLAEALAGTPASKPVATAARSVGQMLGELEPLTAKHDLHGRLAAQGSGAWIGSARTAVFDRFLERNQALRLALCDLEHVATLLAYLATLGETRGRRDRRASRPGRSGTSQGGRVSDETGEAKLHEFCSTWERRLRRQLGAVRKAAVAMGEDPDGAIDPLDPSRVGRAAHGAAYAAGTVGEWVDRQVARRRSG